MLKKGRLYQKLYEQDSEQSLARMRRESFAGVIALSLRLEYLLNHALSDSGLTTMQVVLLATIMREDAPPSLSTVAERLRTSAQNVKQMARALRDKGFIEMERDPADRRAYRLVPTDYSDEVFESRLKADAELMSRIFEVFNEREQKSFFRLLVKLLDHNNGLYDELKKAGTLR